MQVERPFLLSVWDHIHIQPIPNLPLFYTSKKNKNIESTTRSLGFEIKLPNLWVTGKTCIQKHPTFEQQLQQIASVFWFMLEKCHRHLWLLSFRLLAKPDIALPFLEKVSGRTIVNLSAGLRIDQIVDESTTRLLLSRQHDFVCQERTSQAAGRSFYPIVQIYGLELIEPKMNDFNFF